MNYFLNHAFQIEVNRQLDGKVTVNGQPSDAELALLCSITFVEGKTKGRITTLMQSKLYMMDCLEEVNGVFDAAMIEGIKALQSKSEIEATGNLNRDTWRVILGL
jgi:hypothetical protein